MIEPHQFNAYKHIVKLLEHKHDQGIYLPSSLALETLDLQSTRTAFLSTRNKYRHKHTKSKQAQLITEHQTKEKHYKNALKERARSYD